MAVLALFPFHAGQIYNEAALPVYIIHLPMVAIIGFNIIKFDLPIAVKYSVIGALPLISSLLVMS